MQQSVRATRGGVGAVMLTAALATLALFAGLASGAAFESFTSDACGDGCFGAAEAATGSTPISAALAAADVEPPPPEPDGFPFVSARSFALIESGCGALILGRNEHLSLPPASLVKLMTAAVALDHASIDTLMTSHVDSFALHEETGSTIMGLTPGMQLSLLDLVYGLLLPSGNDAAITIAENVAGSEARFVELMNEKAASLALVDTTFTNVHGLDEDGLRSSAYDMALLARYVVQNDRLRQVVNTLSWQPGWDGPPVWNGNRFLTDYPGADGVKIGYTEESQQTIVASATRDGRQIIAAVMRSQDRLSDAARLLDWAFAEPSACP
jgi:D-alanyl-D-alanine carboxypeptidase (penicillin-binding protein 5/6)